MPKLTPNISAQEVKGLKHSTSIYPPFSVHVEYQKFGANGNLVEDKRV